MGDAAGGCSYWRVQILHRRRKLLMSCGLNHPNGNTWGNGGCVSKKVCASCSPPMNSIICNTVGHSTGSTSQPREKFTHQIHKVENHKRFIHISTPDTQTPQLLHGCTACEPNTGVRRCSQAHCSHNSTTPHTAAAHDLLCWFSIAMHVYLIVLVPQRIEEQCMMHVA